jgi:transcriptional regulator with PAS, ATPase and Fis domain
MILGDGEWIHTVDLPIGVSSAVTPVAADGDGLRDAVRSYEKAHIENVLARAGNDKKAAAKQLGIALSSLYRKLEELGIQEA